MAIQPPQPITIPADTADKLWISYLMVNASDPTAPVRVFIRLAPFSSTTNTLFVDQAQEIDIPDLFTAAATNPTLASGIAGLFAAIQNLSDNAGLFTPPPSGGV